jgi:hypothetical protein
MTQANEVTAAAKSSYRRCYKVGQSGRDFVEVPPWKNTNPTQPTLNLAPKFAIRNFPQILRFKILHKFCEGSPLPAAVNCRGIGAFTKVAA